MARTNCRPRACHIVSDGSAVPFSPAAERWAELSAGWGIPRYVLDQACESPWQHDVARFAVDEMLDRDAVSVQWAVREVLPPVGGTVFDVGCGGGRSSLPLVPPRTS